MLYHRAEHIEKDIESGSVYLLEDGGQALGTITCKGNGINRLFVSQRYQKRGYGKALLDFAEQMVFENHDEIVLDASFPAKPIYLARGYREIGYHAVETVNGDFLCYDVMRKRRQA